MLQTKWITKTFHLILLVKVDPDDPEPIGEFPLYETLDFRPRVADIAGASTTLTAVDEITGTPLTLPLEFIVELAHRFLILETFIKYSNRL